MDITNGNHGAAEMASSQTDALHEVTNGTMEIPDSEAPATETAPEVTNTASEVVNGSSENSAKPSEHVENAPEALNKSKGVSEPRAEQPHQAMNGVNGDFKAENPRAEGPLSGKVALVTGAGRGIGAGIAMELARKGADLVINYASSSGPAAEVVRELEAMGAKAIAIKADVTKPAEIESMFQQAIEHFGRVDIVASNSGKEKFRPLEQTTEEDFDEIFGLNTRAQFFVAKAAYKHINRGGSLILMSSIATGIGVAGHSLYAGSKCAVEGFTRCFAADFGSKHCTVNAIAPAGVKSDMWTQNAWRYAPGCDKASSIEQIETALANGSPLKRCAVPADIGRVVAFLASPDGEWINGQIIPLNGGARV